MTTGKHPDPGASNADRHVTPTEVRVVAPPTPDLTDWKVEHDDEGELDVRVWRCPLTIDVNGHLLPQDEPWDMRGDLGDTDCPHTFRLALDAPVATQGMMTRLVADHLAEHDRG